MMTYIAYAIVILLYVYVCFLFLYVLSDYNDVKWYLA